MKNQTILIKQSLKEAKLLDEIVFQLKKAAACRERNLKWFQFAKKTKHAYRFLNNKERQWEELSEVAENTVKQFPSYTMGEIVDKISILVNTTVSNILTMHGIRAKKTSRQENQYLQKLLIEIINPPCCIPGTEWFYLKENTGDRLKAKDLTTGNLFNVNKFTRQNHIYYSLDIAV